MWLKIWTTAPGPSTGSERGVLTRASYKLTGVDINATENSSQVNKYFIVTSVLKAVVNHQVGGLDVSIIGLLHWQRRHRRHPPIGPERLTSSETEPEGRCTSTVRERRTGSVEQQSQPTKISLKLIIYSSQRKTSRQHSTPTTLESRLEAPMEKISPFLLFCLIFPALIRHLA